MHVDPLNLSKNVYEEMSYEQLKKIHGGTSGCGVNDQWCRGAHTNLHFPGGGELSVYIN